MKHINPLCGILQSFNVCRIHVVTTELYVNLKVYHPRCVLYK